MCVYSVDCVSETHSFNVGQTVDLEVPRVRVAVRESMYPSTAVRGCVLYSEGCSGVARSASKAKKVSWAHKGVNPTFTTCVHLLLPEQSF